MDPNDPESVERASAILRAHSQQLESAVRDSIYSSWVRLKDLDAVESKYRGFVDRALRDIHGVPDEYMLSIDMGRQDADDQGVDDDTSTLNIEEQQIRIALYVFWIALPQQSRNHDTLDVEFRKVVDDALSSLRNDPDAFGSEFHWTSK